MVQPSSYIIRRATLADAPALAEVAAKTFHDTFAEFNSKEDMDAYMATAFSVNQLTAELADPDATFFVADTGQSLAGYAKVSTGEAPPCVTGPNPFELVRLYVRQEWFGKGVAQALMQTYVDEAKNGGYQTLWLGVWEENHRAKAFYRKWGFEDVGEKVFMLGEDVQTDRVWVRRLGE